MAFDPELAPIVDALTQYLVDHSYLPEDALAHVRRELYSVTTGKLYQAHYASPCHVDGKHWCDHSYGPLRLERREAYRDSFLLGIQGLLADKGKHNEWFNREGDRNILVFLHEISANPPSTEHEWALAVSRLNGFMRLRSCGMETITLDNVVRHLKNVRLVGDGSIVLELARFISSTPFAPKQDWDDL
jgi:hypothetical protein